MNNKLYNKKGLTFKGAFVVVILAHIIGIGSIYGYSKYKSHQLKLAREEWKNKLEQRDNNQNEWKTDCLTPKVVAKSYLKIPTKPNTEPFVLLEKAQKLTEAFLAKATTQVNSAVKDINKKEKTQVHTQTVPALFAVKKKPDSKKSEKTVNVIPIASPVVSPIKQSTPAIVQSTPLPKLPKKIVPTAYNYQPTPTVVRSVPPPRKPATTSYNYQPDIKPSANQIKSHRIQTEPRLRNHTEFDYETEETVQTFYSY